MNSVNFKANYIKPVVIQHLEKGVYKPLKTSFVKYDTKNIEDFKTLEKVAKNWGVFNYAKSILKLAKILHKKDCIIGNNIHDIYMLTFPQKSYEKVESENVLGCVLVDRCSKERLSLTYLQVNPKYTADKRPTIEKGILGFLQKMFLGKKHTEYKHIGKGILDSIKSYYNNINIIELTPDPSARKFYEKNGFDKRNLFFVNLIEWHRKQE